MMLYWLCYLVAQILLCKLYVLYTEKTTLSSYFILVDFALIWPLLITWFSHSHFYCVTVPPPFSCFFHQWWAEWFYTNQNPFSPKEYPMFFVVVVCLFSHPVIPTFLAFRFLFPSASFYVALSCISIKLEGKFQRFEWLICPCLLSVFKSTSIRRHWLADNDRISGLLSFCVSCKRSSARCMNECSHLVMAVAQDCCKYWESYTERINRHIIGF